MKVTTQFSVIYIPYNYLLLKTRVYTNLRGLSKFKFDSVDLYHLCQSALICVNNLFSCSWRTDDLSLLAYLLCMDALQSHRTF